MFSLSFVSVCFLNVFTERWQLCIMFKATSNSEQAPSLSFLVSQLHKGLDKAKESKAYSSYFPLTQYEKQTILSSNSKLLKLKRHFWPRVQINMTAARCAVAGIAYPPSCATSGSRGSPLRVRLAPTLDLQLSIYSPERTDSMQKRK
jgi:hypothetical protein